MDNNEKVEILNAGEETKCPYCGSQELWKYLYGEPTADYDSEKYVLGGCIITGNNPIYKCKSCNKDIYKKRKLNLDDIFKLPTNTKEKATSKFIRININGKESEYTIMLKKISDYNSKLYFVDGPLENNSIEDVSIVISNIEFDNYVNKFSKIISNWEDEFKSDRLKETPFDISWSVKFSVDGNEHCFKEVNLVPSNWNEFIDFVSELELKYKQI